MLCKLKSVASDADKTAARNAAQLVISGNEAYRGGGIGSNGGVIFGYQDTELPVQKNWKDEQGEQLTENLPESIELQLILRTDTGSERIGAPVKVLPQEDVSWSYTFTSLPTPPNPPTPPTPSVEEPVPPALVHPKPQESQSHLSQSGAMCGSLACAGIVSFLLGLALVRKRS